MDKINIISDIIKISLKFDDTLQNGSFCELKKISDEFNENFKKLKKDNLLIDEELIELFDKLSQINTFTVSRLVKNCEKSHKEGLNTLLLFYSDKCPASVRFYPEWKSLKTDLKGRVNLIAINCKNKKHENVCNFFKIHEYPTLKYVTPTKIHDYFGEMEKNEIINTFLLI